MSREVQEAFLRVGAHHGETSQHIELELCSLCWCDKQIFKSWNLFQSLHFLSFSIVPPSFFRIHLWTTKPIGKPSRGWNLPRSLSCLFSWKVSPVAHKRTHTHSLYWFSKWSLNTLVPLLIDITFIHEGNKTFHDNLVNFEKLVSCVSSAKSLSVCVSKCHTAKAT